MTFFYGRRGPFYKLFVRGDSNGKVNVWKMPEVSDKELNYLKQEEFDTLPGKICRQVEPDSLQLEWGDMCV